MIREVNGGNEGNEQSNLGLNIQHGVHVIGTSQVRNANKRYGDSKRFCGHHDCSSKGPLTGGEPNRAQAWRCNHDGQSNGCVHHLSNVNEKDPRLGVRCVGYETSECTAYG